MNKYPYFLKFAILFSIIHTIQSLFFAIAFGLNLKNLSIQELYDLIKLIMIGVSGGFLVGGILDIIYKLFSKKYHNDRTIIFPKIKWTIFVIIFFIIGFLVWIPLYYNLEGYIDRRINPCDHASGISINGGATVPIYPEGCDKKNEEIFNKYRYPTSTNSVKILPVKPISKVDLKINGDDNPGPIKYNSVFKLDYNISGDVSCFPYDGPVPLLKENNLPDYMKRNGWRDKSFVTFPNMSTSTQLIARDSIKGYVPFITLTMKCGEEQGEVVTDTIVIPIIK